MSIPEQFEHLTLDLPKHLMDLWSLPLPTPTKSKQFLQTLSQSHRPERTADMDVVAIWEEEACPCMAKCHSCTADADLRLVEDA
jgi:hypothetical protein